MAAEGASAGRGWPGFAVALMLGRVSTLVLASVTLGLAVGSFAILAGRIHVAVHSNVVTAMIVASAGTFLLFVIVLAGQVTRVVLEHRRGAAGARLHVRLVVLFGLVAAMPTFLVAVFAILFFNYGIQAWFNSKVQTALDESNQVAQGYLAEHDNEIQLEAVEMANVATQLGDVYFGDPTAFQDYLDQEATTRELTEAEVFAPDGDIVAASGLFGGMAATVPSPHDIAIAQGGQIRLVTVQNGTAEQAIIKLNTPRPMFLMIEKPIDPEILAHVNNTQQAVAEYQRLSQSREGLALSFELAIAVVALLVLSALIGFGLVIANQIARPIGHLMRAAEDVRGGNLGVRVPERATGDEMAGLSRAFNRMTAQLAAQRSELMDVNGQLEERRRFTETVLAGVSAGVIGLDRRGRIELPNRAASELLRIDLAPRIGQNLGEIVPEFAALIAAVMAAPERAATAEVEHGPAMGKRVLLVRIGAEMKAGVADGFIVTFDDVTELLSAQRKAAWADVARRIAHEIKNPLTPIQLSAERLKRRWGKEIISDPENFAQCADTIVRHVGDIGRMVDEFSTFARMPAPVMRDESLERIAREAMVLQRVAAPQIDWSVHVAAPLRAICDRRLIGQALTNLLQNAADGVAMRGGAHIVTLELLAEAGNAVFSVIDDGVGLPETDRARLTEPYVTHKPKGTGLGLAIVRKIMEDHGGALELGEAPGGVGARVRLVLPALHDAGRENFESKKTSEELPGR
jgi:two-component system nitrogen regulation sensor histidine kinase NtrY